MDGIGSKIEARGGKAFLCFRFPLSKFYVGGPRALAWRCLSHFTEYVLSPIYLLDKCGCNGSCARDMVEPTPPLSIYQLTREIYLLHSVRVPYTLKDWNSELQTNKGGWTGGMVILAESPLVRDGQAPDSYDTWCDKALPSTRANPGEA